MPQLVSFQDSTESLVRFVEDTPPADIVEATYRKLTDGASPRRLLEAAGLAVSRSTELPASHHGGPVHPVSGLHAIGALGGRLDGEEAYLPAIQSIALANKHIHSPDMGPAAMAEIDIGDLADRRKDELLEGFRQALEGRQAPRAERHLLALLKTAESGEIMDVLLRIALPRNSLDDHYLLYTVYAFRALETVGWDHAHVVLRPTVRFLTRHPMLEHGDGFRGQMIADGIALYRNHAALEALVDERGLAEASLRFETGPDETAAIDALADRVAVIEAVSSLPPLIADALSDGLSLMGALEAQSVGGGRRFLRSQTGNPFDVHIHTGVSARRYLLSLPGLGQRTRLLALLSWGCGYEVRHLDRTLQWPPGADPDAVSELPDRGQQELLDAIAASVEAQPVYDIEKRPGSIADVIAPRSVLDTVALAQQYAERGYDPAPFFALMAKLVCRDDQSEMHAYKLQQAAYEEYHATRESFRWVHMASAAKHIAAVARLRPRTVYPRARALMDS